MTLEVLISTMMQKDYSLLEKMRIDSDVIVVNQCHRESKEEFKYNGYNVIWINSLQRGLSKSRNLAIANATSDICVLADDDLIFRRDYVDKIVNAFKYYNADLIRFMVNGIEEKFKNYPKQEKKIGYLESFKISSVEIAFLRKNIKNIKFDEKIGAGTKFIMGEENAFLYQCLRRHLNIVFVPVVISDLHIGNSTWFKGINENYLISRGAAFAAMKTKFVHLFILQFAVRKFKLYSSKYSLLQAIKYMETGRREYLLEQGQNNVTE